MSDGKNGRLRLDKWLWQARFFRSRTLATRACTAGRVRINRGLVSKSHATVKPGDILTFAQGREIRVIEIVALGERRGPASEARALYHDLAPAEPRPAAKRTATREPGAGRPTKAERRAIMRLRETNS